KIRDIEIEDIDTLENFLKDNSIDIGVICVPSRSAQDVCNILTKNKVKSIWNFAPVDLSVPEGVFTEDVHLSDSLLTLSYLMHQS
ncbi:MAG TPA: redox-sensing transcriptional repressor Rex, partial [Clostridiales bacterium]|nr:redox-sensing transcriptional repressor Rex [Clostridiales bacterium]